MRLQPLLHPSPPPHSQPYPTLLTLPCAASQLPELPQLSTLRLLYYRRAYLAGGPAGPGAGSLLSVLA